MDSPGKELEALNALLLESRRLIGEKRWGEAKAKAEQAVAIDALQPKALDLLALAYEGLGEGQPAADCRARAKAIREEIWKRQVEAEIRGQHEMLGEASRHEIP